MDALAGPFAAVCAVLALGAVLKAVRPLPTAGALAHMGLPSSPAVVRVLGALELVAASGALLSAGRVFAAVVALSYLGFAAFVGVALRRRVPLGSCGCFGAADTPPTTVHLVLNLAAAAVAVAVAADPSWSLPSVVARQPAGGLPFVLLTGITCYLVYLSMSLLPRLLVTSRGSS